jgi:hypothetical protein
MKNILKILLSLLPLTLFTSCKSQTPFQAELPLKDRALVYIYLPESLSMNEDYFYSIFDIYIDGKRVKSAIKSSEYRSFNIAPVETTFRIVRASIEHKNVTLQLKEGVTYYLKIEDNLESNNFDFYLQESKKAQDEITKKCKSSVDDSIYSEDN